MKQEFLNLLNQEINKAVKRKEDAILNHDLAMKIVWTKIIEVLTDLMKRVQDTY